MKNNKGITLIALVITIIVMLILVAVTITMAVNGGLFTYAGKAKGDTQNAIDAEQELANLPANMSTDQLIAKYTTGQGGGNGGGSTSTVTWTKTSAGDLAIGSTVETSTGENFYVIGGDTVGTAITTDTDNVILLAKYNLKKDTNGAITLDQDTDVDIVSDQPYGYSNACAFCASTAWSGASVTGGDNLNTKTTISSETTSAVGRAIAYGSKLGGSGRLLLKSEADTLNVTATSSILFGHYGEGKYLNFWLGDASNLGCPWTAEGAISAYSEDGFSNDRDYYGSALLGVRPVVEVSIDDIG